MKHTQSPPNNTATEFERFRELTRLILQVPKSKIRDKLKPRVHKRDKHKRKNRDK